MARIEIIKCDVCGEPGAKTCYFTVDRKMDPAGSMDDEQVAMDLCPKHQWAAYKLAEPLLSYPDRARIVAALKNKHTRLVKHG